MELGTIKLKDLPPDKFIISIYNHKDVIRLAVVLSSKADVRHRSHLLRVPYDIVSILSNFILRSKKFEDKFSSLVSRCIIDDDNVVIGVILHNYRLDIGEISIIVDVVVGGNNHTDRQFRVFICLVLLFIVFDLLKTYRSYLIQPKA